MNPIMHEEPLRIRGLIVHKLFVWGADIRSGVLLSGLQSLCPSHKFPSPCS